MNRATPVEMRKALEVVELFKRAGVLFVAMPVRNAAEHAETVAEMQRRLDEASNEQDA
jgi:protein tyrosine phosphatase (PTP) superfamily phosphohydrolase (DUF442 family)